MKYAGVRSILKNAAFLLGAQTMTSTARGVYAVLLAWFLGPEIYGLLNYGQSWYLVFLPLSNLGLVALVSREVGRDRGRGQAIVARALRIRMLTTVMAAVLCMGVGWWTETNASVRPVLVVFSLALVGRGMSNLINGVFTAYESSRYTLRQESTFRVSEVVVGSLVLLSGGGLLLVAAVHAVNWWIQGVVGLVMIRRHITELSGNWDVRAALAMIGLGFPLGVADVLHIWLLQGPLVLFRHVSGTGDALGHLALALQAFYILATVCWAIAGAGLPVLSRTVFRGDGKERVFVGVMLRVGLLFGAVAGLAGLGLGPELVARLFGPRYAETGTLLGLTLWLLIPAAWSSALSQALVAQGHIWVQGISYGLGALALTVSMPPLATRFGPAGATAATALGFVIPALVLVLAFLRANTIDVGQAIVRPGVAVIVSLATYLLFKPTGEWPALAAALLVLVGGTLALRVISPQERSALGALLPRLPGRAGRSGEHTGSHS